MLQHDKRGEVEGDERRGMDGKIAPDRFDEIGAFGGRISVVLGLLAIAHADIVEEELRHLGRMRQLRPNLRPPKRAIRKSWQEGYGMSNIPLTHHENLKRRVSRSNGGAGFGVVADALTASEPCFGRRDRARIDRRIGNCGNYEIGHIRSPYSDVFAAWSYAVACRP